MDKKITRICTVCARGGSKGVPNKNLRLILGEPLVAHTLKQALASALFDYVALSSDSEEILRVGKEAGAHFLVKRPEELARDDSPKLPSIKHCVQFVEEATNVKFDTIVDLDPTSPLRFVSDILAATKQLESSAVSNILSGTPSRRSPYFNLVELDEKGVIHLSKVLGKNIGRRQDAPKCYDINASIYVWQAKKFWESDSYLNTDTGLYVMPPERSTDIDSEMDFQFVNFLAEQRGTLL